MNESGFEPLKDRLAERHFRQIARQAAEVWKPFDTKKFLNHALPRLDTLTLTARIRRMTESFRLTLQPSYPEALGVLKRLIPQLPPGFATLVPPDFVGQYGREHHGVSIDALKFFTPFGTSEFGVRPFIRDNLAKTLRVMEKWSLDPDPHVRRLASEGCRPRLPWSFHLESLVEDPSPVQGILENLRADPSLYVRKSVANHLNDITKDHPDWVLDLVESWPDDNPHTRWIKRRALRTLVKKGDRRALTHLGAGSHPEIEVREFVARPSKIRIGEKTLLSLQIRSDSMEAQQLMIDYAVHYIRASGSCSTKVFKWKEALLPGRGQLLLQKGHAFADLSTRRHHPGSHFVDLMINGVTLARADIQLAPKR